MTIYLDGQTGLSTAVNVKASGLTCLNGIEELEKVAAIGATVNPVVHGDVVDEGLSNVGEVVEFGLGDGASQRAGKARHQIALPEQVVLLLDLVVEEALSKVKLSLPFNETVQLVDVLGLAVEPTGKVRASATSLMDHNGGGEVGRPL